LDVVGLAASVLTHASGFVFGFPVAGLEAAVYFGLGLSGLSVFLMAVTSGCFAPPWPFEERDLDSGWSGGGFDYTSPWKKWFHPSPRSTCSAEGRVVWALLAAVLHVATLFRPRSVACFTRAAFGSSHLTQPRQFAVWFPPQSQHGGCTGGVEHPPESLEPQHVTQRGAYPQLRCVCPNRSQRLLYSGTFGATYDSTDTRNPQNSVSGLSVNTSDPCVTDTMKSGVGGPSLARSRSRQPERSCVTPWTRMFLGPSLCHDQSRPSGWI